MSSQYEQGKNKIEYLFDWYQKHIGTRNEATTRLHLIDTILFESLGWDKRDDCIVEERFNNKYSDYTLSCPRRTLIIEAKKEGIYFDIPSGYNNRKYKISTLKKDVSNLGDAISQVSDYCQKRGAPYAAVTNGYQFVLFIGNRQDGLAPDEGEAFVFESFDAILENFRLLWDLLSKPGIIERNLQKYLLKTDKPILPRKLSENINQFPGVKNRNILQTDLQILSELVFEDIIASQQLEDEFLKQCYCQSGALSQYALISKNLLSKRYESLFPNNKQKPTLIPATDKKGISKDLVADSFSRRPILLIGDVGVGKTMFFKHFIRYDAKDIFKNSIVLYIDFGLKAAFAKDIRDFTLDEIERQLQSDHDIDLQENKFVRGVYHSELIRFSKSIFGTLKEQDPKKYNEKEVDFLNKKLENREQHFIKSLNHITKARQKQVIIFLDNADQRSDQIQQEVFIISQGLASEWPVTVFLAIRPETYYRSKERGSLSAYHLKAFTVSPPRIDNVLEKRLLFGLQITDGKLNPSLLPTGIQVDFNKVGIFLKIIQHSIEHSSALLEAIDNLCAGNVRLALDFVNRLVASGHIDTRKILEIYNNSGMYIVGLHEFLRAIIFGDCIYYDPNTSPVYNIFEISSPDPKEHFLSLIILQRVISEGQRSRQHGFVEIGHLYNFLQSLGYMINQIDHSICALTSVNLLETAGRIRPIEGSIEDSSLRITTKGAYHLQRLPYMFVYYDAISTDITILDETYREKIIDVSEIKDRLERCSIIMNYLDSCCINISEDESGLKWKSMSEATKSNIQEIKDKLGIS